jgi:hypothetical protein
VVDFSKLGRGGEKKPPQTMLETFSRLDRQVTHVELRPSQVKIFEQLDANSDKRDLVVKLNTGGGKTTTGLIYLKHKMQLQGEPVVYLVPTVQLAEQIIEEGVRVGVTVCLWAAGEKYPPEDALSGKSVIVCTYDKFFNGRSTFARSDVRLTPGAIVLDDVHAGIEAVRASFSASLSGDVRTELLALLKSDLKSLEPANWIRIEMDDPAGILEVPHWVFTTHLDAIREILSRDSSSSDLTFSWPYLSQALELCRLVLTGTDASIALDPPALQFVPHYVGAAHRLFMSASIQDGAALVRELDCDPDAAASPIDIPGEGSVGERMVIVPSLADPEFSREQLATVVASFVSTTNVVVLVSSFHAAKFWEEHGAIVATKNSIATAVNALRENPRGQFRVFVQRYDGIDLPDTACRVLVLDGLPQGEGVIDRADSDLAGGVIGMRGKIANRVEQGLGRAVRSSSDYCAVVLAGRDLANFVSRRVVLENFSPLTVRQIEIGKDVSAAIAESDDKVKTVAETLRQCLSRDAGWREYYAIQISQPPDNVDAVLENASTARDIALAERSALRLGLARDYGTASSVLQQAANLIRKDRLARAVLKQSAARYLYQVDGVGAMELQAAAFSDNGSVARPPVQMSKLARRVTTQAESIAAWLKDFANKNGALVVLDQLRGGLSFGNDAENVEAAVEELGALLGADSSRPERMHGRGPDNLWMFDDLAICIELKSEKTSNLFKSDAGQLHLSVQWVEQNAQRSGAIYPVVGSNVSSADVATDFPDGALVINEAGFIELLDRLRKLTLALISQGPLFSEEPANVQKHLGPNGLLPAQLLQVGTSIRQS